MKLYAKVLTGFAAAAALAFAPQFMFADDAASNQGMAGVSGTYTWSGGMGGGGGGGGAENTLVLKQEGTKLTGSLTGGRSGEAQIENGTVEGNKIKFTVTREWNGNSSTTSYEGTVEGEKLKLKIIITREVEATKKA